MSLQSSSSVLLPGHSGSPGCPFSQVRVRMRLPPPQVTVQEDHSAQGPQNEHTCIKKANVDYGVINKKIHKLTNVFFSIQCKNLYFVTHGIKI